MPIFDEKEINKKIVDRVKRLNLVAQPYVSVMWLEVIFDTFQKIGRVSEHLQKLIISTQAWMLNFSGRETTEETNQNQHFLELTTQWKNLILDNPDIYGLKKTVILLFEVISGKENLANKISNIESFLKESERGQKAYEKLEHQLTFSISVLAAERTGHYLSGTLSNRLYTLYSRKEEFRNPLVSERYYEELRLLGN